MAKRTYAQGFYARVIDLARYQTKHAAKLAAAGMPASVNAVGTAAVAAQADAQNGKNTFEP